MTSGTHLNIHINIHAAYKHARVYIHKFINFKKCYMKCFIECKSNYYRHVIIALRGVGLVSDGTEGSICNIDTQEGSQGSDKYQTISQSASRLVWCKYIHLYVCIRS